MDKSKFLKEAKALYKKALEKKWVAEMNFIFSPELILRVWFDVDYNPNNKEGDTGHRHQWNKVSTLPCQADQDIIKRLGEITSPDNGDEDDKNEATIAFLRSIKDDKVYDKQAHGYEFEHNGKKYEISMWENCDHFTIQMLIEHINL